MYVEFEEKTYEGFFNSELGNISTIWFPPGQIQESILGFDMAAFSMERRLWRRFGYPFYFYPKFMGVDLLDIAYEMEEFLGRTLRSIPTISVNLLFQYKRPKYLTNNKCTGWGYWQKPFFRYRIYTEQQTLLENLDSKFGERVLVLYAAPAIVNLNDLISKSVKREIIKNSNFTKIAELNNHHFNTYIKAGTCSIACSEWKKINNFDILDFINNRDQKKGNSNIKSNEQMFIEFSNEVISILNKSNRYKKVIGHFFKKYEKVEKFPLFYSVIQMILCKDITGIQWVIQS